uniref:NADH-ubiquinone oxidoreductase chain 2 n=1 Tax=Stenocephus fraxini TaxID=2963023 RepID=A0A9E9C186_9HYME|nr:NADH dehydrogenase subunit 2 [Stenocephus fraxini]WAK85068.1 NADH dehydrogenase subunit 2 [Stenocephus fraxini]
MMLIYLIILILTTFIAMSTNSWITIWMMLEINLMALIPLMKNKSYKKLNFLFKYFIIQVVSSSSFIFSIMLMWIAQFNNNVMINLNFINMVISISMLMKMALMPFHQWYIEVMMNLSWMIFFLMSSWQKIIPLMIISYLPFNMLLFMAIAISAIVSAMQGMIQSNLRKIFTLSSINHTCWLTVNSFISFNLMTFYMTIYMIISFNIMFMFYYNNINYLHEIYLSFYNKYMMKLYLFFNFLSIAGLPPFLGFMAKMFSIKYMMSSNFTLICSILTFSSLLTLYFYLRITFSSFLLNNMKLKLNFNSILYNKNYYPFSVLIMIINSFINMTFFIYTIILILI